MKVVMIVGVIARLMLLPSIALASPIVTTAEGRISGLRAPGLRIFLGIPYARPPVGKLRWREPRAPAKWKGVRGATKLAPSCIQGNPVPFGPYTPSFLITPERSEDCLYLNVWSPARGSRLPVYFFIHGGAFQSGGASVAAYNGAALARKGVVVVTINYRLGIFGFFAHPELTRESPLGTSGNYGILDTIEALRWVRANIGRFGGNPSTITIAGQSAGAGIVDDLLVSPLAKGLFQRAVLESGPALGLPMPSLAQAQAAGAAATSKLGPGAIAALRSMPPEQLAKTGLPNFPLPNADGKVIAGDPENQATPIISRVPIIIGYNRDETASASLPRTRAAFESDVRRRFGTFADRFLASYPHATDEEAVASAAALARDRLVAELILWGERNGPHESVYAYRFERRFPGLDPAAFGAFHTAEVPYVFGALDLPDARFTAADRQLSAFMQARWVAFMRTGSPNSPGSGPPWQRLTSDPSSIWRIDRADRQPLLAPGRLELFRAFVAGGGRIGLL